MREGLVRKSLVLAIIVLFVGAGVAQSTEMAEKSFKSTIAQGILYVGGNGTGNYSTIQSAINDANPSDTIFVYNGTYYENVVVNKTVNLIGEDCNNTIIDGGGNDDVIQVIENSVYISGFTIQNCKLSPTYAGVDIHSESCTIENNNIVSNVDGIFGHGASDMAIANNTILLNNNHGIYLLSFSNNNTIIDNNITGNYVQGIRIQDSFNNTISDNKIEENIDDGINLYLYAHDNIISNNIIKNNYDDGIQLYDSCDNNIISNNIITDNTDEGILLNDSSNNIMSGNNINSFLLSTTGIFLDHSDHNIIFDNYVHHNYHGIEIQHSELNTITCNNLTYNNNTGVWLRYYSNDNKIFNNNLINNTWGGNPNAFDECSNIWDDGYPSGGNYWNDYTGLDNDGDGIGDTPYLVPGGGNKDNYPFMEPYGWINSAPNTPDRPSGEFIGEAGVKYKYTTSTIDPDNDIVWYKWDWGDGFYSDWLGPYESGEKVNAVYSWSADCYLIRVKAKDIRGQESNWSEPLEVVMINPSSLKNGVLLFGSITNLRISTNYSMFDAVKVLWLSSDPFKFMILDQYETIVISNNYFGKPWDSFIFGVFKAMILEC